MQLGIHINAFHRPTLEESLDAVVEHGLACVHFNEGIRLQLVRAELEAYGFTLAFRPKERSFRGVRESPYTLYRGNPMCAGGGGNEILGLAD